MDHNHIIRHCDGLLLVTHAVCTLHFPVAHNRVGRVVQMTMDLLRHHKVTVLLVEIEVCILDIIVQLSMLLMTHLQIFIFVRIQKMHLINIANITNNLPSSQAWSSEWLGGVSVRVCIVDLAGRILEATEEVAVNFTQIESLLNLSFF